MNLQIKNKEYSLRLRCGKFRELRDTIGGDNLLESLTNAMGNSDADVLGKAFQVMCISPRLSRDEAFAALDTYLDEGHTVMEFGNVIMEVLDESGFLPKRGMAEKIQQQTQAAMEKIDEKIQEIAQSEIPAFSGFKA